MKKRKLTLLHGGYRKYYPIAGKNCHICSWSDIPADLEAVVFEEDTHLVLTVDKVITYKEEHPIRIMTEILHAKVHMPGDLVVNGKSWYGIVVDLDCETICRREWVEQVYWKIGQQITKNSLAGIGIHLLGNIHGRIPVGDCVELFIRAIANWQCTTLREIWLIVPEQSSAVVRMVLGKTLTG